LPPASFHSRRSLSALGRSGRNLKGPLTDARVGAYPACVESRHGTWIAVGGALLSVGVLGLIGLVVWAQTSPDQHLLANGWFRAALAFLVILGGVGFYGLAAPFLGLSLPPTRAEPFWHRGRPPSWSVRRVKAPAGSVPTFAAPSAAPPFPSAAPATPEKAKAPKQMAKVSPRELVRLKSGAATEIQGDTLIAQYVGQWREASVVVGEVIKQNEYVVSVSGKDSDQTSVTLFFKPDDWADRLSALMPGDSIMALGRIHVVTRSMVLLDDCELVESSHLLPSGITSSPSPRPGQQRPAPPPDTPAVREPCKLSPKELVQLYGRGATELQAAHRVARYIGKWREVSGTLQNVEPANEYAIYVTCIDSDGVPVSLFFSPSVWASRLRKLKPNDPIAATGCVGKVSRSHVLLDHCELLTPLQAQAQRPTTT
jgi:hypothetical protein